MTQAIPSGKFKSHGKELHDLSQERGQPRRLLPPAPALGLRLRGSVYREAVEEGPFPSRDGWKLRGVMTMRYRRGIPQKRKCAMPLF